MFLKAPRSFFPFRLLVLLPRDDYATSDDGTDSLSLSLSLCCVTQLRSNLFCNQARIKRTHTHFHDIYNTPRRPLRCHPWRTSGVKSRHVRIVGVTRVGCVTLSSFSLSHFFSIFFRTLRGTIARICSTRRKLLCAVFVCIQGRHSDISAPLIYMGSSTESGTFFPPGQCFSRATNNFTSSLSCKLHTRPSYFLFSYH